MKPLNYSLLCHKLEAQVDKAISQLEIIPGTSAKRVKELLLAALTDNEEDIIKDRNNLLEFPTMKNQ